jgi:exopolysaccharide biosynthesis polyprenyl glycosylphosphotransferase
LSARTQRSRDAAGPEARHVADRRGAEDARPRHWTARPSAVVSRFGWRPGVAESAPPRRAQRRDALYRRLLAVADVVGAMLAVWLCVSVVGSDALELGTVLVIPLVVIVSKVIGLYDRDELLIHKTTLDEAPALFHLATLYTLLVWFLQGVVFEGTLGRGQVLVLWLTLFLFLAAGRALARQLARRLAASERCLVIGSPEAFVEFAAKAGSMPGVDVCGYVTPNGEPVRNGTLEYEIRTRDIHRVVVAADAGGETEAGLDLIRSVKSLGVKVSVMPRVLEAIGRSVEFDDVRGAPVLGIPRFGLTRSSRFIKRSFDFVGAALGLLAIAPLMVIIATAVKLDSRGPVFFGQRRIGRDGRRFRMLKFRSMVPTAEAEKARLAALNEANGLFKIADDPRITRVGRWLRRTSLDELPQLFNVLRGEMSLVGPRPLIPEEDERVRGWSRHRLRLTPGMTGHWQVLGSARIPLSEMVAIDYLYIANWSLWTDAKILLRTVPYVLGRNGL